jgi:hypothetical protein
LIFFKALYSGFDLGYMLQLARWHCTLTFLPVFINLDGFSFRQETNDP